MEDRDKTKDQLIAELAALRHRVSELEESESRRARAEESLRESEECFRKAFDTELVAMAISRRRDGMYLEANPGFLKMTGYSYDEIIGHTSRELDFFSPSQRQTLVANMDEQGRLYNQELTFPAKNGELRTILFSIDPLRINNEDYLLATMVDITERRRMEEALRRSRERYRSIYHNTPVMLHSIDRNNRLLNVSDHWLETLGYKRDEVIGRRSTDFLTEESRRYALEVTLPEYFEAGFAKDVPYQFVKKNGEVIDILLSAIAERDQTGEIVRSLAVLIDVTERRRAQEAYQALVEYSLQGLCIIQEDRVVFANMALADMFGYTVAEILAMSSQEASTSFLPEGREFIRQQKQARRSGEPVPDHYQIQVYTKDGDLRWTEQFVTSITYQGRPALQIAVVDITERKQAEEALQKSEANLKALIENSGDRIWAVDPNYRLLIANSRFLEGSEKFPGRKIRVGEHVLTDNLPPEVLDEWRAYYDRALSGESFSIEVKTGFRKHVQYVDYRFNPILTDQGQVIGVTVSGRDITDRKQMEETLQKSEERFRTLVNVLPQFVAYTGKDLNYRFVNRTYQEKFGVTPEDLIGRSVPDVIGETAFEEARPHIERVLQGEQVRYHECLDYAIGGTRDIDGILVPDIAENGEVQGYYAVLTDITPYIETQEALRQASERLQTLHEIDRAILEAKSLDEIAQVALRRIKPLLSCHSCSVLTYDAGAQEFHLLGTELAVGSAISPGARFPAKSELVTRLVRGETVLLESLQIPQVPSKGQRLAAASGAQTALLVPLVVRQEFIGLFVATAEQAGLLTPECEAILSELADSLAIALQQARLQEQTCRDAETKALLLQEVNHRVLNNLTMILSILHMEQRRPLENKVDFRAALQDVAGRIDGVIAVHRMLTSAQWTPLDLGEVVAKIIQVALSGSPVQDQIEVLVEAPEHSLCLTSKETIAVAMIINELTTNSIKYAFQGRSQGRLHVQIVTSDERDRPGTVELVFRDDGPGLPEEVLAGKRRSVGLWLVEANTIHTLGGGVTFWNDGGAVVSFTFEQDPLDQY